MNATSHDDVSARSAADQAQSVRSGSVKMDAPLRAAFERMDVVNAGAGGLNALLSTDLSGALDDASVVAVRVKTADVGEANTGSHESDMPLCGIPIAVKDNIATLRMPTTCGSRILEHYISPFESTAITKLRAAGALIVAKTNMDEFAMGSSTENSAYGAAHHPLDHAKVPGGSSGGSAVAVASGIVRIALGSETGGSVRQPAAFCGVVGVKPTYGRVSRHGLIAYASSLEQIGVFGQTVDDAALGLSVIAGSDPLDATTVNKPTPDFRVGRTLRDRAKPLAGIVVGRPTEYFPSSLDPEINARLERVAQTLRELGADVRDVSLPHTALAVPVYYIVAPAEASSNLARFDGVRYGLRMPGDGLRDMYERTRSAGFGAEVIRRILLGTYVLSAGYYDAYYKRAQAVRQLITRDFTTVFAQGVHVLLTPTTPTTAFAIGAMKDPYEMYLSDIFTVTANLAGIPGMSLPIGRSGGMPVGGQLLASHFDEQTMFTVAYALEHALGAEART